LLGIMRSASLFAVAVLAVVLALSSAGHVYAQWGVVVSKIAIGGEDTVFGFKVVHPSGQVETFLLKHDEWWEWLGVAGDYVVTETAIPPGWVLTSIDCGFNFIEPSPESSWEVDLANARVTVHLALEESVVCDFINERIAVGGVVAEPVKTFAILGPWLAVIGLVGCISTVVVVAKKRRR
jgi:hypothetical protein